MGALSIPNVPAFQMDDRAGDMAMLALESALRALGEDRPAWWLAGVSGDAFKFLYDRGAVFEPLRDRVPLDTVTIASAAAGWQGQWVCGGEPGEVRAAVREALEAGFPALSPFLAAEWYHGMALIVGLEEGAARFELQIGRDDPLAAEAYVSTAIPERWSGPVPGSLIWADNPIFSLEGRAPGPEAPVLTHQALGFAMALHNGEPLAYSAHPGAQEYSKPQLEGRRLPQGLEAFQALAEEVREGEIDWPLIWRMDAQCGQLSYDRQNASRFLRHVAEEHVQLVEAAEIYRETANLAAELQRAYWDKRWNSEREADSLIAGIGGTESLVYSVTGLEEGALERPRGGWPVLDTLWGPAWIVDEPSRRERNLQRVEQMTENEARCLEILGEVFRG